MFSALPFRLNNLNSFLFLFKSCSDIFWSCFGSFLQIGHKYLSSLKCIAPDKTCSSSLLSLILERGKILLPISLLVHRTVGIYSLVQTRQEINRWNNCSAITALPAALLRCLSLIPRIKRYLLFLRSRIVWSLLENGFLLPLIGNEWHIFLLLNSSQKGNENLLIE